MRPDQQRAHDGCPPSDEPTATSAWPRILTGHDEVRRHTGYRLVWEYLETDRVVVGQYIYASLELARAIAQAMDALWPKVRHRPVPACDLAELPAGPAAKGLVEASADPARA
jgi:hypothetical protein